MSKKIGFVLITGLSAGLMTGCGFFGGGSEVVVEPAPETSPSAAPEATPSVAPETTPVAAAPTQPSVLGNLTPPTNPGARVEILTKDQEVGRSNPFSNVRPPKTPDIVPPGGPGSVNGRPGGQLPIARPKPPEPKDAQAVKVFGVALVAGGPQAIILAPGEAVTRTVQVGDILANDVRVTNISAYGPTPTVVFEQYGQQVPIAVGQPQAAI